MAEVRRSPQAEADLEEILRDRLRGGETAAARLADAFAEKSRTLAQFPEIGRLRPEVAPNVRSTLVHPYVIFYRIEGEVVQILRILHGKRDLRRIMQDETED